MIHPKIGHALLHGRKLDAKRKSDKFAGMRGVSNRKKSGRADDDDAAEASTDSFVVTEKTADVVAGSYDDDKSSNGDETKARAGKMYDSDDYYSGDVDVDEEDGLTVEDRLKNLFKKDLNEKLFARRR